MNEWLNEVPWQQAKRHNLALSVACVETMVSPMSFFNAKSANSDRSIGILWFNYGFSFVGLLIFLYRSSSYMWSQLFIIYIIWLLLKKSNLYRYCSNLYPKAESYKICNWCLSQKDDTKEKSQNSSNSSSSNKNQTDQDDHSNNKNIKRNGNGTIDNLANLKGQRGTLLLKLNDPIKKQRSPEDLPSPSPSPSPSGRRRLITKARMEEKLRRTKSEEITNRIGVTRQVFRNKVRRYKLLDEVSS